MSKIFNKEVFSKKNLKRVGIVVLSTAVATAASVLIYTKLKPSEDKLIEGSSEEEMENYEELEEIKDSNEEA